MKKIILALALLTLAACQTPQQRRTEAAVTCLICMFKAQTAEANLKACPAQVRMRDGKESTYQVFKLMSEITFKETHATLVQKDAETIKKDKKCKQTVERIQSGNMMYEFLAVKS